MTQKQENDIENDIEEVAPGVWMREIPPERRRPSEEFVQEMINLAGGEQTFFCPDYQRGSRDNRNFRKSRNWFKIGGEGNAINVAEAAREVCGTYERQDRTQEELDQAWKDFEELSKKLAALPPEEVLETRPEELHRPYDI